MTTAARALPAIFDDSASGWDKAMYAFLAEKERRSGSRRTVESYGLDSERRTPKMGVALIRFGGHAAYAAELACAVRPSVSRNQQA